MNESLIIGFTSKEDDSYVTSSGRGSKWAEIEQKYKTNAAEYATINDLNQMLGYTQIGESPYKYIANECPYASVNGDIITVSLDFYVWPSSLDLPYNLSTGSGTISSGIAVREPKEFDLVFRNSDFEEMDFIFEGRFTEEMPVIRPDGTTIYNMVEVPAGVETVFPTRVVEDSYVTLSEPVYTVLRGEGYARGYKHTIKMDLNKSWEANVEELTLNEFGRIDTLTRTYSAVNIYMAGGTYNYYEYPIEALDGGVTDSWELRFINSSVFNLYNGNNDYKGSGNITEDFITDWLIIRKSGWTGVWESGDYLGFTIIRSAVDESSANNPAYETASMSQAGVGYNTSICPIIHRGGAIETTWIIDFINSTVFNLKDESGVGYGSGNINEDFATQYFILEADGWYNTPNSDSYIKFKVVKTGEIDRTGYKIENLENSIILSYVNDEGEVETKTLKLEIPQCVDDLLTECPGDVGTTKVQAVKDDKEGKNRYRLDVYFNTCDGSLIEKDWVDTEDE